MVTGKDLILYILKNDLENEPVCKDGKFIGFITVPEAAAKMEVGPATILALIGQDRLDYISIGGKHYISDMQEIKKKGE